ncbi:MAG: hypothetical protein ACRC52_04430, partial [Aeromonas veronii]
MNALFGPKETQSTSVQKQELDPRMAAHLFGESGSAGIFGAAKKLYEENPSGMNGTMRQGLNMARQELTDPMYRQSFDMMRGQGMNLMGAGVAGNPFMQMGMRGPQPPMQSQPSPTQQQALPPKGRADYGMAHFPMSLPQQGGNYTPIPEPAMAAPAPAVRPQQQPDAGGIPPDLLDWLRRQKEAS